MNLQDWLSRLIDLLVDVAIAAVIIAFIVWPILKACWAAISQ